MTVNGDTPFADIVASDPELIKMASDLGILTVVRHLEPRWRYYGLPWNTLVRTAKRGTAIYCWTTERDRGGWFWSWRGVVDKRGGRIAKRRAVRHRKRKDAKARARRLLDKA